MRLLAEIGSPAVGVNLDYGNIVAMPDQPALPELLDEAGDRLYYVHLKNSYGFKLSERIRASLAEGDVNHRQYLRLLKERGYTGPLCIEAPRPGDREWFAQEDLAYLRAVLVDIGY